MSVPIDKCEPPSVYGCGERPASVDGGPTVPPAVPPPVAAAWQSQIARDVLAQADGLTAGDRLDELQQELALDPPPPSWRERTGDYALLAIGALVAVVSMAVVVARSRLTIDIALAAASALALAGGHAFLRARRHRRAAVHEGRRATRQAEVSRMLAEGEARRQRLDTFSRLAAEIAHEVRNPLGSIVLNTELLEDELHACIHANPEVKRLARAIGAEADRLSLLTNEYLTFARLPQVASAPQSLGAILEEVACFVRGDASRASVAIEVDASSSARALVDARLVRQLLLNLVRNAIDAMPGGGRLSLRAGLLGDRAVIDVIDTGSGVSPGLGESIFDPFVSTKSHGTGLGLAVARRVARDHGGELRLMPSAQGAWFRVELPAQGGADAGQRPAAEAGALVHA
jgi:signal transduction histidine kinase